MGVGEDDTTVRDTIDEFLNDDNEIVTCKRLSLTLNIPVNSAKLALFEYMDRVRKQGNNGEINAVYFVSGFETKECGLKVLKCVMVPEDHLESVKQTLDPLTSCHVYSLQKAKLKDYTALYQTDYDIVIQNIQTATKLSAISCPWAKVRAGRPPPEQVKDSPKVKESVMESESKKLSDSKPASSASSSSSSTAASGKNAKKPETKKGGIASMFAAADKKKKEEKPVPDSASKPANSKFKAADSKQKGIAAFTKPRTEKPAADKTSPVKSKKEPENEKISEKRIDSPKLKNKDKAPAKQEPKSKKRRRIRDDLFDSSDEEKNKESDDEEEEEDVEVEEQRQQEDEEAIDSDKEMEKPEEEPAEEEEEKIQTPPKVEVKSSKDGGKDNSSDAVKTGKKRKRTRKLVPKQHIDEDGFMVTEKVWESDSTDASEDEDPAKVAKKESPANSSKPKAAPQAKKAAPAVSPSKNKQTSLMSFFKKK